MLKSGTGLLLSLAHQATITSVRIDLTQLPGCEPAAEGRRRHRPQDFKVVATADNTGGTVRLTLRHPASAPLPADLVHPAAAERRRPVPGERLPRPGQRPPLAGQRRPSGYAKGRAE